MPQVELPIGTVLPGNFTVTEIIDCSATDWGPPPSPFLFFGARDGQFLVHARDSSQPADSDEAMLIRDVVGGGWNVFLPEAGAAFPELGQVHPCAGPPYQTMRLSGPGIGPANDIGLFMGGVLLLQEGSPTSATRFAPGNTITTLWGSRTSTDERFLVLARVQDPSLGIVDTWLEVDVTSNPNCSSLPSSVTETALVVAGDQIPAGSGQVVKKLTDLGHTFDINARGDHAFLLRYHQVFEWTLVLASQGTHAVLVSSGAPVPGGTGTFTGSQVLTRVDLNDFGEVVFATETSAGEVIVKNGVKLYETGDNVPDPSVGSFQLVNFGFKGPPVLPPPFINTPPDPDHSLPVFITNSGDVIWFGEWNDPNTAQNEGIFINDRLLVRESPSLRFVVDLDHFRNELEVSANGRYVLFMARPTGQPATLFSIDIGESIPYGVLPGCAYSYSSLGLDHQSGIAGGTPTVGTTFHCTLSSVPPAAATGTFFLSSTFAAGYPCGPVVNGRVLLVNTNPGQTLLNQTLNPIPATVPVVVPAVPSLIGTAFYAQAWFKDAGGQLLERTNGLRFVIGAQ